MGGRRERLLALCVLVLMCVWGVRCVHAIDCKAEVRSLVNSCKPVLYGKVPSSACCAAIRAAHVGCVCPKITPRLAPLIDVKRAVRIVRGCGRRVPRHFKCGTPSGLAIGEVEVLWPLIPDSGLSFPLGQWLKNF
ncbi:hypothetical protein AMTR_s00071p00156280 [Amborella trichopoda]|uniref:Bifunctional inhibitor/plant lipid transfer protein/seed storage helical domain-containing protein n=1 Tax=Amborella trichopoda TaxID=13333 RepID=U5DEX7_AMBTC|nr:hypothetical protein AMTR_s00071p00156280 [Amborella trichopoda]